MERIALNSLRGERVFDAAAVARIAELGRMPAATEDDTLGGALDGLSRLLGTGD